jgi:putative tryptophan/tyrosine transport system substrate-binding protein
MSAGRSVAALVVLATIAGCAEVFEPRASTTPLVALLRSVPDPAHAAFLDELRGQRLVLGRDFELRPADPEQVYADEPEAEAALDQLDREPALIVAYSTPLAQLATERYPDVPVVSVVNDPVTVGLVADRDRPEGWVTGVTFATPADRTLELAADAIGGLERLGYLVPADDPAVIGPREALLAAAEERGTQVVEATFTADDDVPSAVDELVTADVDAVLLGAANAVLGSLDAIEAAVTAAGVPAVANNARATFAVAVLEPDGDEVRRQVARQVARLLAGEPVETVAVEDPRRFRIVLDRGRAQALGLPPFGEDLLRQADLVR